MKLEKDLIDARRLHRQVDSNANEDTNSQDKTEVARATFGKETSNDIM